MKRHRSRPRGKRVSGVVCCGVLKSCTPRIIYAVIEHDGFLLAVERTQRAAELRANDYARGEPLRIVRYRLDVLPTDRGNPKRSS